MVPAARLAPGRARRAASAAAGTDRLAFQPTPRDPAVVVIIDEIDETGKIEGASKILEFLASKQRKAAVCLILAGQRATATWTGGSGVRINLSTVVTGLLARDSEARHAVGAENEIPDISQYSGGEAGFFQIWSTRAKKILARGRSFYIGTIGEQQEHIISKRDPAARPVLEGAGEVAAPAPDAPREQGGSALRERLAHVRELNEGHPLPSGAGAPSAAPGPLPGAALPVVPGVPPGVTEGLIRVLAQGPRSALALGQTLGLSKSAMHRHLATLHEAEVVEKTPGRGRSAGWQLARRPQPAPPYVTIHALAQAVHEGLVEADGEQREVLEQVWQLTSRPHLALVPPLPEDDGDGE
jgi:DNA-binding transcriptional ArsR family regulator